MAAGSRGSGSAPRNEAEEAVRPEEARRPDAEAERPEEEDAEAAQSEKSVEAFRDALERSAPLSRERVQEVLDDAVRHGRITRGDANELVNKLLSRGRKQTDELLGQLDRILAQVRREVGARTGTARRRARGTARKAARAARDAADQPLEGADRLRRRAGVGGFPISAYDRFTVAQVVRRLGDLDEAELREVRAYERSHKARKGVLTAIERRLPEPRTRAG